MRVEGGDTSGQNLAVAVDIGTTTVSAELVDLENRKGPGGTARIQRADQVRRRCDYPHRIRPKAGGTEKAANSGGIVHQSSRLTGLWSRAVLQRKLFLHRGAGNTTMTHLLLGMETRYIREAPYVPEATFVPLERAGRDWALICLTASNFVVFLPWRAMWAETLFPAYWAPASSRKRN